MPLTNASSTFLTTFLGTSAGSANPNHWSRGRSLATPGNLSTAAGIFPTAPNVYGFNSTMAKGTSFFALTSSACSEMEVNTTSTSPVMAATCEGWLPLKGIKLNFIPAPFSRAMSLVCQMQPVAEADALSLPGFALAAFTNWSNVLNFESGLTEITPGAPPTM